MQLVHHEFYCDSVVKIRWTKIMTKEFPRPQRPREDLILDFQSKRYVKGEIVQYLASHQISGLRFLYKNFKDNRSCFLNDGYGLGKKFQMVAFLSAVCNGTTVDNVKVLIVCRNANKLLHWNYHCSVLLPKVKTIIADNRQLNADTESKSTASCIILSSLDNALAHTNELKKIDYRFVVVHDERLEVIFDELIKLRTIISGDSRKVIVCSADMLANTRYFYHMLKFCDLRLPLFIDQSKQFLNFNEFNKKFGGADDRSVSKRNLIFRQKNLLNVCHDFYLRRFPHQVESILPLVDKAIYDKCFNRWKTSSVETGSSTINCSWFDDDMEVPPTQIAAAQTCIDKRADPIASTRCDDYESQMSPLVYQSSESDEDDNAGDETVRGTPTESITSTNGKQTSRTTKGTSHSDDGEVTERILRSQYRKRSLRSSNTKHQTEPNFRQSTLMEIKAKKEKTTKSRQKKTKRSEKLELLAESYSSSQTTSKSSISSDARKESDRFTLSQETSASDIQLVQEELMTPIIISSSTDSNIHFTTQMLAASPDIFSSFTEQEHADPATVAATNSSSSTSPIPAGQSRFAADQNTFDGSETICTQDIFADSQDIANTTNPVVALSTTTSDIFEITRNNVFHNVLRVNEADAVTPVKHSDNAISIKSCFSGVRVVLPRLKSDEILELQRCVSQRAEQQNQFNSQNETTDELIDLTAESQLNVAISSEDAVIVADIEKTPQRKRPLTPSTRSCVGRLSTEIYNISSDDEAPSKTPTRSGWLSKRASNVTSPHATPRSRRRLDKWFPSRTNDPNNASTSVHSILQPRNIFQKKEPKQMQRLRTPVTLESPSIFSSDDE